MTAGWTKREHMKASFKGIDNVFHQEYQVLFNTWVLLNYLINYYWLFKSNHCAYNKLITRWEYPNVTSPILAYMFTYLRLSIYSQWRHLNLNLTSHNNTVHRGLLYFDAPCRPGVGRGPVRRLNEWRGCGCSVDRVRTAVAAMGSGAGSTSVDSFSAMKGRGTYVRQRTRTLGTGRYLCGS